MILKVSIKPNPFTTTLTLEASSDRNKQIIVKMIDPAGRIIKMFGWFLIEGTNVTTMPGFKKIPAGEYSIDLFDQEGVRLHSSTISKQ